MAALDDRVAMRQSPQAEATRFEDWLLRGAGGVLVLALAALGGQYVAGYGTLAPVADLSLPPCLCALHRRSGSPSADRRAAASARAGRRRTRSRRSPRAPMLGARAQTASRHVRGGGPLLRGGRGGAGPDRRVTLGRLASGPVGRTTLLLGIGLGASRVPAHGGLSGGRGVACSLPGFRGAGRVASRRPVGVALTGAGLLARGLGLEAVDWARWIAVVLLAGCALCAASCGCAASLTGLGARRPRPRPASRFGWLR